MPDYKDRIRVHIAGQEFSVVGGGFQEMLAAVKQINGRRFVSELKVWQLPGTVEEVGRQLDISGYRLEGGKPVAAVPARPSAAEPGNDRIRVLVEGRRLAVVGGSFQDMLAAVKNLPGRRFDGEARIWQIPGELAVVKGMIEAAGFQLEGAENIPLEPAPPMERPDFFAKDKVSGPPPFEEPDFFDNEDSLDAPDWWDDDMAPPPFYDEGYLDEPNPFDPDWVSAQEDPAKSALVTTSTSGDRIRIQLGEISLAVTGGSFQQMLAAIKSIPGRRFNAAEKVWQFPDEVGLETIQQAIKAAGFEITAE